MVGLYAGIHLVRRAPYAAFRVRDRDWLDGDENLMAGRRRGKSRQRRRKCRRKGAGAPRETGGQEQPRRDS